MSTTVTLPLLLELTLPRAVKGPCSREELERGKYIKYNPETQVCEIFCEDTPRVDPSKPLDPFITVDPNNPDYTCYDWS